jgi:glycosyltransferase involved in cell wall biosynthesis
MGLDVGVVIATFNRSAFVLDAIDSVVSQTEPPRQLIVVDDGSTDDTRARIRDRFPDVVVLRQDNRGQPAARNAGIGALDSEWVAFLDDDDLWHPMKLERTAAFVNSKPGCAALRTPLWFFSDGAPNTESAYGFTRDFVGRSLSDLVEQADAAHRGNDYEYLRIAGLSFERMLELNRGALSSTVVKRDIAIKAGGFPVQLRGSDDWLFFLNVARFVEWELMEDRLSFVRIHPAQATHSAPGISLGNLGAKVAALYGGRPLSDRPDVYDPTTLLARYAPWYREEARSYFWDALRRGEWHDAFVTRRLMLLLLPRLRDRLPAYVPPPLHHGLARARRTLRRGR